MELVIENCDLKLQDLHKIIECVNEIVCKENRNYEDNKQIRNILDELDSLNITFNILDLDMVSYTMLLSLDNNIEVIEKDEIKFLNLGFNENDTCEEYNRLLNQYNAIHELLSDKINYELLEYLQPNTRLIDVRLSLSIKEFLSFILTCSKYNELMNICLIISDYDDTMEILISTSLLLDDFLYNKDLFNRTSLNNDIRRELLESPFGDIKLLSNEGFIRQCNNDLKNVKVSLMGVCSLVAYREIIKRTPNQTIKLENFNNLVDKNIISIVLPKEYSELDSNILNTIDGYIYDWYILSDKIRKEGYDTTHIMMTYLGCYNNIFKMNTNITNYYELLDKIELSELNDIFMLLEQKLKEVL